MVSLSELLPIIVYFLVATLLVVLIILGIKLIQTIEKTNAVLDDIERKSKSLNGLFDAVNSVTDSIALVSDRMIEGVSGFISKLFKKKKRVKKEEDVNNE